MHEGSLQKRRKPDHSEKRTEEKTSGDGIAALERRSGMARLTDPPKAFRAPKDAQGW